MLAAVITPVLPIIVHVQEQVVTVVMVATIREAVTIVGVVGGQA